MTGTLKFRTSTTGPLLEFQLNPLRLERTHRLSRRFGCDRFMELDIPCLTSRRVPKIIKDLGPRGKTMVIEWLGDIHHLMARMWVRFYTKPTESKPRKVEQSDVDPEVSDRVYFFATDGNGFKEANGTPSHSETVDCRSSFSVEHLLNWIRPTWENGNQPALKLYARTALALSRNTGTFPLERTKIRFKQDIVSSTGEIMTDGAGRMSQALSLRITTSLGLSYLPSGFQGRLGGAKGFWSVDPQDHSVDEWIEVYESQLKWARSGTLEDKDFQDPSHYTFEVNKFSGKLKPANLNQQLMPILMEGAISKPSMRATLINQLETCLESEIGKERIAMNDPQSFRKWVRDAGQGSSDRIKHGYVPYKAGMPESLDERIKAGISTRTSSPSLRQ